MNAPVFFAAASANANKAELLYVWGQATPEAKVIIVCLLVFSITAWTVMIGKAVQMRRAKKLNLFRHGNQMALISLRNAKLVRFHKNRSHWLINGINIP